MVMNALKHFKLTTCLSTVIMYLVWKNL